MSRPVLGVAAVAAAVAVTALPAEGAKKKTLRANLSAGQEVPDRGPAGASARARITIVRSTGRVCWQFTKLNRVVDPTAAHIHAGKKGKAGPVAVALGSAFSKSGCTTTDTTTAGRILDSPKVWYVNVHTKKHPAGAVRGQLRKD